MIVFLTGNLLQVNRLLPGQVEPGSSEDMPSLTAANKANILALYAAKLPFILDLARKDKLPAYAEFKPHGDVNMWYVPTYMQSDPAMYEVEYMADGAVHYSAVAEHQFEDMMLAGIEILAIVQATGEVPSKRFRDKFGLRRVSNNEFVYAVPGARKVEKVKPVVTEKPKPRAKKDQSDPDFVADLGNAIAAHRNPKKVGP